jgi:hypothetical protein
MPLMRFGWRDALISGSTLAILLATLVAIDERARTALAALLHRATARATLETAGGYAGDTAWVVFVAIRDQSLAHGPLVVFVAAAAVLVLFLVRT